MYDNWTETISSAPIHRRGCPKYLMCNREPSNNAATVDSALAEGVMLSHTIYGNMEYLCAMH